MLDSLWLELLIRHHTDGSAAALVRSINDRAVDAAIAKTRSGAAR